jgi:hypothetical protein
MHTHPTKGVIGSRPRSERKNDLPNRQSEEVQKLSKRYLRIRNEQMSLKAQQAAMLLAKARDELVLKSLVERQASFLLVALRQKILSMPLTYSQRLLNIGDVKVMNRMLREMAISLLNELMDLPSKVVNPDWLEELEAGDRK